MPDDPDDLESDLEALAGPSAGPGGNQIFIDSFTGGRLPPKSSIREIRINSNPFSGLRSSKECPAVPEHNKVEALQGAVPAVAAAEVQVGAAAPVEEVLRAAVRLRVACPTNPAAIVITSLFP